MDRFCHSETHNQGDALRKRHRRVVPFKFNNVVLATMYLILISQNVNMLRASLLVGGGLSLKLCLCLLAFYVKFHYAIFLH